MRSSTVLRGSRPLIMIDDGPFMTMIEAALNVQKRAHLTPSFSAIGGTQWCKMSYTIQSGLEACKNSEKGSERPSKAFLR